MERKKAVPAVDAPPPDLIRLACWLALFFAAAFVPDEKIVRAKMLALELGVGAVLAGWAAWLAVGRAPELRRTPLDAAVAAYGAASLLFYAISPERHNSELELTRILFSCAAYAAATQTFPRLGRSGAALIGWSAAAGLAGLYAVLQRLGSLGPLVFPQADRPAGTFGNPVFLGAFLAASLVMTLVLLVEERRSRRLLSGSALFQAAGLCLTQSRAAMAGLLAALLLWVFLREKGKRHVLAAAALLCAAAGLHFHGRQWTHGLIWSSTFELWKAHPWLGCGLGRFHLEFPAYASSALKLLWPQQQVIVNFAHNEYLQVLAETGLAGLALFAALPLLFWRWLARSLDAPPAALAPALAALCLFAAAFVSPDMRFGISSFLAFSAMGMAQSWASRPALLSEGPGRLLPAALCLAFVGAWGQMAVAPALAHRRLKAAVEFHIEASAEVRQTLRMLEDRLKKEPGNADLAENLGYLYAKERAWTPALSRFELAARLAPDRPGPENNLGNIYYSLGDFNQAISHWQRSLAVDPQQLDAHLNLGKLLFERGRLKESAYHLQKALELQPSNEKARILLKKMVE